MKLLLRLSLVSSLSLMFAACGGGGDGLPNQPDPRAMTANFDLSKSIIPFPNNLLFSDTEDGTINIPIPDAPTSADGPALAMNALDGFSTTAPLRTSFSVAIDPASLGLGAVRVFRVTATAIDSGRPLVVQEVVEELVYGEDFFVTERETDLIIMPLKPLLPKSTYTVIVDSSVQSEAGDLASASLQYQLLKLMAPLANADLEPIRQLVNAELAAIAAFDSNFDRDSVVVSWSFNTQSIGDVLTTVRTDVSRANVPTSVSVRDTIVNSMPNSAASIYSGTMTVPYMLALAANAQDTAPLTTPWRAANEIPPDSGEQNLTSANPLPEIVEPDQTIPLLVSVPETGGSNFPVVIFQHGITRSRTDLLAVADSLAQAGFAAVAIDLPLHGITGLETDGSAAFRIEGAERIFDIDLINNDTGAAGRDGTIDASGSHFINLTALLVSRDNLRQGVSDLFTLRAALGNITFEDAMGDPVAISLDTDNVHFLGMSLGAMVGTAFLALEPDVADAVLAVTGGGILKLLDGSASFGPRIAAGLAANGIMKGSSDYEAFLSAAQTVIDTVDPINHGSNAAFMRGILFFEVVGGGSNLPDQTVPNHVGTLAGGFSDLLPGTNPITFGSPIAGTDPLAIAMGLTQVNDATNTGVPRAWVRFTEGTHGSLLDSVPSSVVTGVMQNATAEFLVTDGASFSLDTSVVE